MRTPIHWLMNVIFAFFTRNLGSTSGARVKTCQRQAARFLHFMTFFDLKKKFE